MNFHGGAFDDPHELASLTRRLSGSSVASFHFWWPQGQVHGLS